jgi:hypothetical protein
MSFPVTAAAKYDIIALTSASAKCPPGINMPYDSIALRTASRHVEDFGEETDNLAKHRDQAQQHRDGEIFLQLGIDAFDWLIAADRQVRSAVYDGNDVGDWASIETLFENLCRTWLARSQEAVNWLNVVRSQGHQIANTDKFLQCHEEMTAIVRFNDQYAANSHANSFGMINGTIGDKY